MVGWGIVDNSTSRQLLRRMFSMHEMELIKMRTSIEGNRDEGKRDLKERENLDVLTLPLLFRDFGCGDRAAGGW